jgi:hypothetical protein
MKPTVPDVLPFVDWWYRQPGNAVGGSLHIVLDDTNIDNDSLVFCANYAHEHGDWDGVVLAGMMLQMSKTQRLRLCYENDGGIVSVDIDGERHIFDETRPDLVESDAAKKLRTAAERLISERVGA